MSKIGELPRGAPITMRKRGKKTDSIILEMIREKPGLSVNELSENLKWSNGRVDGSINRLFKQGKIRIKHYIRRGILVKKVYPIREIENPRIIRMPKEIINSDLWEDSTFIYALSRSSIALSSKEVEEWAKKSFWKGKASIERSEKELVVELPEQISEFYRLENSETSLSTSDDFALITVESTIVPLELFETFPALPAHTAVPLISAKRMDGTTATWTDEPEYYGEYFKDKEQKTLSCDFSKVMTQLFNLISKYPVNSDTSEAIPTKVEVVSQ